MLHLCNAMALFFAVVVARATCLWFNSSTSRNGGCPGQSGDLVQTLENLEMKKTLVALAALAATASFAQSSVSIYGNLDQALWRSTDSSKQASDISSNAGTTSVLGFKGTEDMGGGLSANFNLLSELSLKEGQMGSSTSGNAAGSGQKPNIFTRGATVGVASKTWGSLDVGRVTDSAWTSQGSLNNTGMNSFGWNTLTATSGNPGATGVGIFTGKTTADTTFSGTTAAAGVLGTADTAQTGSSPFNFGGGFSYTSPNLGGLVGSVQSFGTTNSSPTAKTGNGMAYSLNYTTGALRLVYGNSYRAGSDGAKAISFSVYGAEYKMGQYTFVGGITKNKYVGTMAASQDDVTVTGLGIGYDLTPQIELKGAYTTLKNDEVDGYKTKITAVTARYKFSARTSVYGGYGRGSNDGANNKQTVFYGGPAAGTTAGGVGSTGMLVGIKHAF